jgi:hypothetical protein
MRAHFLRIVNHHGSRLAHHLQRGIPQHALGARVENRDQPDRVGRDDRDLGGGVEQRVETGVDLHQLGLGPPPPDEQADLPTQCRHGLQQRLIALERLSREERHHPENRPSLAGDDRKAERAAQTRANRELSPHQSTAGLLRQIGDPGRAARGPDSPGQPDSRGKFPLQRRADPNRADALRGPRFRRGPQHACLAIDHPALGHVEIQQPPDGGEQVGNRVVQAAASRQDLHGRVLDFHSPLGAFSLRDVTLHGDEVDELSRLVVNGLDLDRRPVFPPPLAVVEQFALESHARADPFSHQRDCGRIALRSLEKRARLPAQDFLERIASNPCETLVDPLDVFLLVGDDHGVIGAAGHQRELPGHGFASPQRFLGAEPLGDLLFELPRVAWSLGVADQARQCQDGRPGSCRHG